MRARSCTAVLLVSALMGAALGGFPARGLAQGRIPVKMAQATMVLAYAPLFIARDLKFFEAEGVALDLQMVTGVVGSQALAGGTVDFDVDSSNNVVRLAERGLDALTVQGLLGTMTMNLIVRRDVAHRKGVSPSSPLAQRFQALKGLTLGITTPGAAGDTYTRWMLKQAGLDPLKDVNIVQIGAPDALQAAMAKGQVDAFLLSAPTPERLERDGVGVIIIKNSAGDTPEFRRFLHTVVATRREYAERNPEAVQRVTRAIARGANFLLDQTEEGKKVLQQSFPRIPADVLSLSVDNMKPGFLRNGRMSEEHWKGLGRVFQDVGITKGPLDPREGKLWTNRYLPSP